MSITASVITMSDKGAAGLRDDTSGPALCDMLTKAGMIVVATEIIPDDHVRIVEALIRHCGHSDLVITTGGTGFSPRDITPEATREVIEREVPGIPEAMRAFGRGITPRAMLARGVAGIRGRSLIVNLPGSRNAALESLLAVIGVLPHAVEKLKGSMEDCA